MLGVPLSPFPFCLALTLAVLLSATPASHAADTDLSDPDAAVEAGRSALKSQSWTPWYDSNADGYKPINLPPPRRQTGSNWNWSWLSMFGSLRDVFVFLMWLLVAAIVVWIVIVLLRAWMKKELEEVNASAADAEAGQRISRVEDLPMAIDKPTANLLGEARRLAALGDYAAAIVYLFSHQLVEADHAGAVRLRKGKTNRQYLRELRRNRPTQPDLPPLLEATVLLFERAFFGAHAPSVDEFDACLSGVEQFDKLLQAEPQKGAA